MYNFPSEFLVGINNCWLGGQYDHDYGRNMLSTSVFYNRPYTTTPSPNTNPPIPFVESVNGKKSLENMFQNLGSVHNIQIIRVWAFERFEALRFDDQFNIIGIDQNFLSNIEKLLEKAKENHVKIYLCLFDAWPIFKSVKEELNIKEDLELLVGEEKQRVVDYQNLQDVWKQVLKSLIKDNDYLTNFLDNVMKPLLEKLNSHEGLFAIDVFNEPESLVEKDSANFTNLDIIRFVNQVSRYVKNNSNIPISCGFKEFETIKNNFSSLQYLDFFDFHSYQEKNNFHLANYDSKEFGGKECIIGECGYPLDISDNNEIENRQILEMFFVQAVSKGYSGLLSWVSDYVNSKELFVDTVNFSMKFPVRVPVKPEKEDKKCFIASASLGTVNDSRIYYLREYRKFIQRKSRFKNVFTVMMDLYYVTSPPLAGIIRNHKSLKFFSTNCVVNPLIIIVKFVVKIQLWFSRRLPIWPNRKYTHTEN